MNREQYEAAKAAGDAGVVLHGEATLLVKSPGGFDPATGAKLPPTEMGVQRADLRATRDALEGHLVTLHDQILAIEGEIDGMDALLADADALLGK